MSTLTGADTTVVAEPVVAEAVPVQTRIDTLIATIEHMLVLTSEGRNMFTATEVIDLALDCRSTLIEVRDLIPSS